MRAYNLSWLENLLGTQQLVISKKLTQTFRRKIDTSRFNIKQHAVVLLKIRILYCYN